MRYAQRLASVLRDYGVKPGQIVAVTMNNCPEISASFQAAWIIGAAILPIMPQLIARELNYILDHSEARVVITSEELTAKVVEAASDLTHLKHILVTGNCDNAIATDIRLEIEAATPIGTLHKSDSNEMALLVYTSGTTGEPKGVMLSHSNVLANAEAGQDLFLNKTQLRFLSILPLAHVYGVLTMNLGNLVGTISILHPHFDPRRVFEDIEKFQIQRISVVPTMMAYMAAFPDRESYDLSSLEQVNSGGAPLSEELRLEFEEKFNCTATEGWGQSESTCVISSYRDQEPFRPGSAGRVISNYEICTQDQNNDVLPVGSTGELCVKGPHIMKGYWKNEEETRNTIIDEWLHTGDIGHLDKDGYVYITDRKKDLIIKGGENISPRGIEETIYRHPSVLECAVFGIPSEIFGEDICAAIANRQNTIITEDEIKEHIGKLLNRFQVPLRVVFMDQLPKSSVGKLLKRKARERVLPMLQNNSANKSD
jgi:long-chain acyl-CoA synthetase